MKISPLVQACSLASLALIASVNQASAQSETLMLEEVIVTAQKRAQSLQDVPISVVAFGTEQLEAQGIDDLTDIAGCEGELPGFPARGGCHRERGPGNGFR